VLSLSFWSVDARAAPLPATPCCLRFVALARGVLCILRISSILRIASFASSHYFLHTFYSRQSYIDTEFNIVQHIIQPFGRAKALWPFRVPLLLERVL
jgi:hypothetical protein